MSSARVRLSIDCSMNVAGRKMVVSTVTSGSPGAIAAIASSTPRVTSMVLAPRNFWTTSMRPGPPSMTASPQIGPESTRTVPTSARRTVFPFRSTTGTAASCSGPVIGCTSRMLNRLSPDSTKPPVPTTAPSEYFSKPASSASAAESITCWSVTSCSSSSFGSTWTCRCGSRSPQIATWATPGTRSSRDLIFQ